MRLFECYDSVGTPVSSLSSQPTCQLTADRPDDWVSYTHPQGWVYFYHPKTRAVTNDDIRQPEILDVVERYIATYPFSDLSDNMELLVPHDPQTDEHIFSVIVNHESCMAGYSPKDVKIFEGIDADHGSYYCLHSAASTPHDIASLRSEQTTKDVLELP